MAANRGDSSRFHRLRKQKARSRDKIRILRAVLTAELIAAADAKKA